MVLFQNGVRQLRSPAKMTATVQLRCYWKQLWSRWAITGSWEPLVFISGSIVYALHQIMHKAGSEQHRIFGLEKIKKKLWTIVQFCLSDWLHLAQTAVLDSIPLSFSLHLHGMGTILTSIRKIIPVKYVYIQNQVRNVQIVYSSLMTILVILKWPLCFEFNWMQLSWKN